MTDKILCPWCGAEMYPTATCAVPQMEWHACYICPEDQCVNSPEVYGFTTVEDALEAAKAAALHRYTPLLRPMTLEELWKEEDPVWVEDKNGALCIGDFYVSMSAKNGWDVQTLGNAKPQLIIEDDYGRTWRCWSRKPTDEERSAAEWET